MVSKASDDFPEPDGPVTTVIARRGISRSNPLRLCWRAPRTVICDFMFADTETRGSSRVSSQRAVGADGRDGAGDGEDETPERKAGVGASREQVANPSADERARRAGRHGEERTAAVVAGNERDGDGSGNDSDEEPNQNAHVDTSRCVWSEPLDRFGAIISARMCCR